MDASIVRQDQAQSEATIAERIESRARLFLSGPFGSGKTTLGVARVRWLLRQERVRGDSILVLVAHRTLAAPFLNALRSGDTPAGPLVQVTTLPGLARRAVELYWPLVAQGAGFLHPEREPTFLNAESSQYHMAAFVDEALAADAFAGLVVDRNRVTYQILDNLNKAALHGFSIDGVYERLAVAVPPGAEAARRLNALQAAQRITHAYRDHCLADGLVDFSLQMDTFARAVLTNEWSKAHLFRSHRHLVADNVEEESYAGQRLIAAWLPQLDSALALHDEDAGYRFFLGANPEGVPNLAAAFDERARLERTFVMSPGLANLAGEIDRTFRGARATSQPLPEGVQETAEGQSTSAPLPEGGAPSTPDAGRSDASPYRGLPAEFVTEDFRFYPQMIAWAAEQVRKAVEEDGVPPSQVVVLAPVMSDALRFSLLRALEARGIPAKSHRPSRPLEAEPATHSLITLAQLAHPHWGIRPATADVTLALTLAVTELDPVRAHILAQAVFPERKRGIELERFAGLPRDLRDRVTYRAGEAFDHLREWLYAYRAETAPLPLDQFFARLFGEVLSQPGYGFHDDYDAARIANQLVQSARAFRWALGTDGDGPGDSPPAPDLGRAYAHLIRSGLLGGLYVPAWHEAEEAVLISPATTYLLRNRPVEVQVWLDLGSSAWWERLYQPLTHPYVLSAGWPPGRPWTDLDEFQTRQEAMRRVVLGLLRRARRSIYAAFSSYSETGYEQAGPLLRLVNSLLAERT